MNMLSTIVPKSDQLNSDDLIGRTMTITVTKVSLLPGEQPCAVHFEGDNNKPYKPGKSMRRVMVSLWGPDANAYVGRSMTLFRDEKVAFGGMAVGGIRISHMSHIDKEVTMALTATKGSKKLFTVKPLKIDASTVQKPPADKLEAANFISPSGDAVYVPPPKWMDALKRALASLETLPAITAWRVSMEPHIDFVDQQAPDVAASAQALIDERVTALSPHPPSVAPDSAGDR